MADGKTEQTHKHIFHLVKSPWTAKPSLGEVLLLTNDRGSTTFRGEKMSPSSLYTKENCKQMVALSVKSKRRLQMRRQEKTCVT